MKPTTDTVIFARVSSKAQEDEGYSLESQHKFLSEYCYKRQLNVVKVFKIAETASKQQRRKVFKQLTAYLYKARIYHLAVEKTDRFTRNFKDSVEINEWLEEDDNRCLHAVKESLVLHKTAKSDAHFQWNLNVSLAQKYTDNLREEAMKGWAEKLAQGWLPCPPPPGYITVTQLGKKIHVPDPETRHIMSRMFNNFLDPGETVETIEHRMDLAGLRTKQNRPFSKSHVHRILTNPFYIGINRFDGKEYPGAQEPIVSKEIFERVQQKLHRGRSQPFTKHHPTLQGLIRCEDCGSIVTWSLQKGRYYGVCRRLTDNCKKGHTLREDHVEALILEQLKDLISPVPEVIDWVVDALQNANHASVEEREKTKATVEAHISKIERMDENLYDDKLSGAITKERYEVKHEQFTMQINELYTKLEGLDSSAAIQTEKKVTLLELSQKAAEIYASKSSTEKSLIISKLFENLKIKEGNLSVTYTKFVCLIANKVQKTRNLMEV